LAPDDPLLVRADAARRLIAEDSNVCPDEMLAAVVWPESERLENAQKPRKRPIAEDLDRIHELRSYGWNHREIGDELGWPRPTITDAVRRDRLKREQLTIW
jgi:IS30 family transposase